MPGSDLVALIRAADLAHDLFRPGEAVVVAVSGGPDSVALLDALVEYRQESDLELHVAHLDHTLREDAVTDAVFVARLAARLGVPASLDARDVRALAAEGGRSVEEAARTARYAYLAAVAADVGAETVAVAHHADDQAETVLMNFLRGSGLDGLKGMAPSARYPLPADSIDRLEGVAGSGDRWPPRVVRPLLAATRTDIEAYLTARGLESRSDPTNRDTAFLRNRLRHEILPALESVNPRLREALVRNAAALADDLDLITAAVDRAWSRTVTEEDGRLVFALLPWSAQHRAVRRRLVRRAVARLGVDLRDLGAAHVEDACRLIDDGDSGSKMQLPGGLGLSRGGTTFEIAVARPAVPLPRLSPAPRPLPQGRTSLPGGWAIEVEARDRRPGDPPRGGDAWRAVIDAAAVPEGLAVRGRRPGDRLQPLGLGGRHKSLADLFTDHRVARVERDGWPLVVAGERIVWVPGQRLDERARVRRKTRQVIELLAEPPARITL